MRFLWVAMIVIVGASAASTPVRAQGICQRLWVERNSIYKAAGYCFNTQRGIRYFGNAGCSFDNERDVPLSARERERVAQLVAEERANGCR